MIDLHKHPRYVTFALFCLLYMVVLFGYMATFEIRAARRAEPDLELCPFCGRK